MKKILAYIILFFFYFNLTAFAVDIRGPGYSDDGKTGYAIERRMAFDNAAVVICVVDDLGTDGGPPTWDNDRGAYEGTLEECIDGIDNEVGGTIDGHVVAENSGKVIIFDVAGRIDEGAFERYTIDQNDTVILGQTAPAPGIVLTNTAIRIAATDVMIQHIGLWSSDDGGAGECDGNGDLIEFSAGGGAAQYVVVDHVSGHFSTDTAFDMYSTTSVTDVDISYSIIGYQIGDSDGCHTETPHDKDLAITHDTDRISVVGNLFGCVNDRKPLDRGAETFVANNGIISESTSSAAIVQIRWDDNAEASWYHTYVGNLIKKGTDNINYGIYLNPGEAWDTSEISLFFDDTITYGCSSTYAAACVDDYDTTNVLKDSDDYLSDIPSMLVSWANAGKPTDFVADPSTDVAGNISGSNEKWKVPGMRPGETRLTPDADFISEFENDDCTPVDDEAWVAVTTGGDHTLEWPTSDTWAIQDSEYTKFEEWVHENYTGPAEDRIITFGAVDETSQRQGISF